MGRYGFVDGNNVGRAPERHMWCGDVTVAGVSLCGRRGAGAGMPALNGAQRPVMPSPMWLIAVLVVLVACVPVLNFVSSSDTRGGPAAGASHHDHSHSHSHSQTQDVAQAAQLGLVLAAHHVIAADHSHAGVLHQMVYPGIDGMVSAVRSMNPLRMWAAIAVIAMALVMFAFASSIRSRAPPIFGAWLGPARPGQVVIADLCVIRR